VLSRMTHALEQLIGGLDSMIDIDSIFETRGKISRSGLQHAQTNTQVARHGHKHATVAQRLRTEFQGILEACLDTCPGHSSARSISMSRSIMTMATTADDDTDPHEHEQPPQHPPQPPQTRPLVVCPMPHVQLDILLSAQIRFHLRR
jgi:hypothetical protein